MINGCCGYHCATGILYGILQLLTACLIVGWVWSIVYGVKIMQVSGSKYHHDVHVVHHHHHHGGH